MSGHVLCVLSQWHFVGLCTCCGRAIHLSDMRWQRCLCGSCAKWQSEYAPESGISFLLCAPSAILSAVIPVLLSHLSDCSVVFQICVWLQPGLRNRSGCWIYTCCFRLKRYLARARPAKQIRLSHLQKYRSSRFAHAVY